MISYIKGRVVYKTIVPKKINYAVVDVGGVGYKVYLLDDLINELDDNSELELFVYTQVAETALDLYGFKEKKELDFFELLLTVSGVGPKSAMDILQKAKIEDLRSSVMSGSAQVLNKVSGIGPKTAEKIVLGLKDKLGSYDDKGVSYDSDFGDALDALIGLGYNAGQARDALAKCQAKDSGERVKEALRLLGR